MQERNVVAAIAEIKFLKITGIFQITVQQITFLVADFAGQRRAFESGLVTFDNVTRKRRIPVIVRRVIEPDISQIEALFLVATELGSQKARLASALQGRHNHRKNRHRHVGDIQHHRPCGNRLLGLHHHAASVKIKVLVSRIATCTEIAAGNLDSRIRQTTDLHAVQLLVVLERRRVIHLAYFGLEVVLEAHAGQRRVFRFAKHRVSRGRQNLIFLVHPNRIGFKSRSAVLELRRLVQVERRSFHVIDQIDRTVFNRIHACRIVHPIDFRRVFHRLFAFLKLKAGHLLAIRARSKDRSDKNCKNGPQKTMGFG